MRIVVSGATGFVGSHTIQALAANGHEVLSLAKHAAEAPPVAIAADLAGEDTAWQSSVRAFAPEAAIHLAWEGIPDYGPEMSARNERASIAFFGFLESICIQRIVGVGSSWENMHANAFTAAKDAVRHFGESLDQKGSLAFAWARIFFAYGPRQRSNALIPSMVRSIQKGESVQLTKPQAQNDFIYIEDVAHALALLATTTAPSGIYEIGSGVAASVQEIARLVHEQFGMKFELVGGSPEAEGAHIADIQRMKSIE